MIAQAVASTQLPHQARSLVRLAGADTLRFLQGILSADISPQRIGEVVSATLLTIKAKIVSEVLVIVRGDEAVDLWLPAELATSVSEHLDRHIIMDEVEVLADPGASLAFAWGTEAPARSADAVEVLACSYPVQGWLLVGPSAAVEAAVASLTVADAAAFATHRIEHAIPAWGHEVLPGFFPPEVGFTGAVSYAKGCFMGQEPLARIHARGHVNRVMVRVELGGLESTAVECPALLSHPDRDEAGTLTTAAGQQGLAIVRRNFAVPGTTLGGPGAVTVISGPLGDDAGVPSRS